MTHDQQAVERVRAELESALCAPAWSDSLSHVHAAIDALEATRTADARVEELERRIAILRRALVWHGDHGRMATTREEWQQEVDDAMVWVRNNPDGRAPWPMEARTLLNGGTNG